MTYLLKSFCKCTDVLLYAIRFVFTTLGIFEEAKGDQLVQKDLVNSPKQTDEENGWFSQHLNFMYSATVPQITKNFRGKERSAAFEVYDDIIGPWGFIEIAWPSGWSADPMRPKMCPGPKILIMLC